MKFRKTVVADERISCDIEDKLRKYGFEIIKLPCADFLQEPVSAHPDMLLFISQSGDKIICHKQYFEMADKEICCIADKLSAKIILSHEKFEKDYPFDVLFNVAKVNGKIICRKESTSKFILDMYKDEDIIDVKQGYSKCSCALIADKGIITCDKKIAEKAELNGIETLLISEKYVELCGYDCGFIGGCCGDDGENIYFCGNIDLHPDNEKIKKFCEKFGRKIVSLSDKPLYDYGTLIFV